MDNYKETFQLKKELLKDKQDILKMTIQDMVDKEYLEVWLTHEGSIEFSKKFYDLIGWDIKPEWKKELFDGKHKNFIKRDLKKGNYREELFKITLDNLFDNYGIMVRNKGEPFDLNIGERYFRIYKFKETNKSKCYKCGKQLFESIMIDFTTKNWKDICEKCWKQVFDEKGYKWWLKKD